MGKVVTSGKQKQYSHVSLKRHNVFTKELKNEKLVREALIEALTQNDLETFQDVLIAYLRTVSRSKLAARTGVGRQTLYDLTNKQRRFNPTLSTLGAILSKLAAQTGQTHNFLRVFEHY